MNKYRNIKYHGFDSKKEDKRYLQLKALEEAGEISNLERQVKYELIPSQKIDGKVVERACTYTCDFRYVKDGQTVVEDVKSSYTSKLPEYVIKRKLMLFRYGIRINEVKK